MQFSRSVEIEANEIVVSAKVLANKFSSPSDMAENIIDDLKCGSESEAVCNSVISYGSVKLQKVTLSTVCSSYSMRLPEIPLPNFSRDLADGPVLRTLGSFYSCSGVVLMFYILKKIYHLLGCLELEAPEVVKGITVSSETYSLESSSWSVW